MTRAWPPPLQRGDLVAAIAPSGPADPGRVARGVALIESWGLRVRLAPSVSAGRPELPYLAATDHRRAADLQSCWEDDAVRAVWAARGGYGAQRMVDLIDWSALRAMGRKHLVGFSDVTALHTRLGRELDQVTLHGPSLASSAQLADPATAGSLRTLLLEPPRPGRVLATGRTVVPGTATGLLVGGNLSLLAADTGIEPSWPAGSVLLLEEVNEPAYRIDRMITQLRRSGRLADLAGVVLGDLGPVGDRVLLDRLGDLGGPLIDQVEVGHGARNLALPLGAEVTVTAGGTGSALFSLGAAPTTPAGGGR